MFIILNREKRTDRLEVILYRFNINISIIILFLWAISVATSAGSQSSGFSPDDLELSTTQYYPPKPIYPSFGAIPHTSKLRTTVHSNGIIGTPYYDAQLGQFQSGFQFPVNRGVNYMFYSGLWVGGIVDGDTLVSTTICKELIPTQINKFKFELINDFHPNLFQNDTATTTRYTTADAELFHTTFADTIIPIYNQWSKYINKHKPLGLDVTMKTFTKDSPPFKNIILLDFIITNISDKTINSAYVGMYVNTLVSGKCSTFPISLDDLVGSFKEEGAVYIMDNDGDLNTQNCQEYQATGAMVLKTMATYPPPSDTNFNWWTNAWHFYAPQKKGTADDPFRNIGDLDFGTPVGDSNRYYIMSHKEWDYDQCFSKSIPLTDTTWLQVDDTLITKISKGDAPNFLLSLGPFDIKPDSSVRTIFALVGVDLVHLYKDNLTNLIQENYATYYSTLFFDIFFDNLYYAKLLTEEYLNPLTKPIGLHTEYKDSNSTLLRWDAHLFPDVSGYNVYLKKIPDAFMLPLNQAKPNISFDSIPTPVTIYSTERNQFLFENLQAEKNYITIVTQITENGESENSDPILIRVGSPFLRPAPVTPVQLFTPIDREYNYTSLRWNHPDNSDIKYFKIYRTSDSMTALTRHNPFLYSDTLEIPFAPKQCYEFADSSICYYEWQAFDSVTGNIQYYTDTLTNDGYYYWITALNYHGVESQLSPLIKAVETPIITKDIVAVIGAQGGEHEFVSDDSLVAFYHELLQGYNYDIYKWLDSGRTLVNCSTKSCVDWNSLASYKLILVNEFSYPNILTDSSELETKLFTQLSDLRHNIAYFGIPTGDHEMNLANNLDSIIYNETSFEREYMGLDKTNILSWFQNYNEFNSIDSLSGFNSAIPNNSSLPELHIKSNLSIYQSFIRELFSFDDHVPFVPTFSPTDSAEVLYTFQSAFPQSSRQQGQPVGIVKKNRNNQVYTFGFHLWAIEMQSAQELVAYLLTKQSQNFSSYTLPNEVALNQNFPNPFNAGTTISFSLPTQQKVSVKLFNILGQQIKTLLSTSMLDVGTHNFYWDGTNNQNDAVATGLYFYRIQTEENSYSKKMILLK